MTDSELTDEQIITRLAVEVMGWEKFYANPSDVEWNWYTPLGKAGRHWEHSNDWNPLRDWNHTMEVVAKIDAAGRLPQFTSSLAMMQPHELGGGSSYIRLFTNSSQRAICLAALQSVSPTP